MKYSIIRHGQDVSDYFPGVSTVGSKYDNVSTGIGQTEQEAYEDAIEGIYQIWDDADLLELPEKLEGASNEDAPEGWDWSDFGFWKNEEPC